ncbi:MAG: redoxin domain-containing protein [Sedimentisphaerales bacterium]|nr:redoxin domain-containing protein [Sedimentisphaerales bacterium]
MRNCILIMICFLCNSAYGAVEGNTKKAIAALPKGISIELIGLRSYSASNPQRTKSESGPWWRPDGRQLETAPDKRLDVCSWSDSYLFLFNIEGKADCSFKAVGPWDDDLTVEPTREIDKGQGFQSNSLHRFVLRLGDQKNADIKLAVASGKWNILEEWPFSPEGTPYDYFYPSSHGAIMRCPEQKGSDIIAEVTQTIADQATRLVLFDRDGNQYISYGDEGGKSGDLVRYIHYFKNINKNMVDHLEFQARSYDYWITFQNVSMQMGQKTHVQVKIKKPGYLLPGESLPDFNNIKIDLAHTSIKDKSLLVCFFDMEQRPSRNCVLELSKKARELKSKDIEIIAIQAAKVEQDELDNWIKENNISFQVGIINESDEEQTRFNWGVKALPWLILTDKNHIVKAEGFSINELDEKIGEGSPVIKDDIISRMRSFDEAFMQSSTIVVKTKSSVKSRMQAERGDKIEEITIVLNKRTIAVDREISYTEMPVYQNVSAMDLNPDGTLVVWRPTRERSLLEPDFQGYTRELKGIHISPDGETTEFDAATPSFDFYRPDDMQRYSYFWYPILATGRGFSQYLSKVIGMHKTEDGLISFSASGFSHNGIALTWQMVVDPNADCLVRSASYELKNASFSIDTTGIKKFDGHLLAQRANIGTQIIMEILGYKPEVNKELLETTINILRGPLPKGSKVYDWVTNPGRVAAYIAGDESQTESLRYIYNKLTSKALPDLKQLIVDFDPKQIDHKIIIICFFDIEQRPSRNAILELSKKAKELKAKDIEIIAIHTSKVEQEYLDKWLKENNISLHVGMIKEYEEKIRYDWGVQALPWLILTDKEHIIKAEGFSLDQLNEKIKEMSEK